MLFSLLIVAATGALAQETVKDRWIETAGEDYNVVGRVVDARGAVKCLGLVSKGKYLRTLTDCLGTKDTFEVAVASAPDELVQGKGLVRNVGGSTAQSQDSAYVGAVTLGTAGNPFTPLNAVDITGDFDYHVNFVAYRLNGKTLEKRSFRYVDPRTCLENYPGAKAKLSTFSRDLFCVQPTFETRIEPFRGSPLIARPRNNTSERYVSGLFKLSVRQLFYFAKVKGIREF